MEMQEVKSSSVHSVGYDKATKTLAVKFRQSGATYHYSGVDEDVHARLMAAESKGIHIGVHIRGRYKFTKHEAAKVPHAA